MNFQAMAFGGTIVGFVLLYGYWAVGQYLLRRDEVGESLLRALQDGDGWGLELAGRVWARGGPKLHSGNIYGYLRWLEEEGLVRHREEPDDTGRRGGRPRYVYSITAHGRTFLELRREVSP